MSIGGIEKTYKMPEAAPKEELNRAAESVKPPSSRLSLESRSNPSENDDAEQHAAMGEKELIDVIEKANKALDYPQIAFKFSIHKGTKEILVKVLDKDTGDTIREIPPEKILDMVAKMWELAGIIVDEKV